MTAPSRVNVLGVPVSVTTYEEVAREVVDAGRDRRPLIVSALAVHGLMTGVTNRVFGRRLAAFDRLTPDGQPVRWAVNALGRCRLRERVYGPTLTLRICEVAAREGVGIYLFGSREEVVRRLAENLSALFPGLRVAGWQADRFRDAAPDEDEADMRRIRESGAGIVFCGRGCPRQEHWAFEHRERVGGAIVAVGAAFDFHAGTMPQAPHVLQRAGLEWLYRLLREPRRLWRRYLLLNPLFLGCMALQVTRLRAFPAFDPAPPHGASSR